MAYTPEFKRIDKELLNCFADIIHKIYENRLSVFGLDNGGRIPVFLYMDIQKINGFWSAVNNWKHMIVLPRQDKFENKINEVINFLYLLKRHQYFNKDYKKLIEECEDVIDAMKVMSALTAE
jgi:hypothetical protein